MADCILSASASPDLYDVAPLRLRVTPEGYRIAIYAVPLDAVPVDFFADPDGQWSYEGLAAAAGFAPSDGVAVGALTRDHFGHPEGSAVVTLNAESRPYVAIVECPIAYEFAAPRSRTSAA
jgi:hypothetical protein